MQSESSQVSSSNACGIILKGEFVLEVQLSLVQNCAERKYVIILGGTTASPHVYTEKHFEVPAIDLTTCKFTPLLVYSVKMYSCSCDVVQYHTGARWTDYGTRWWALVQTMCNVIGEYLWVFTLVLNSSLFLCSFSSSLSCFALTTASEKGVVLQSRLEGLLSYRRSF